MNSLERIKQPSNPKLFKVLLHIYKDSLEQTKQSSNPKIFKVLPYTGTAYMKLSYPV
jgi:hypothetical protein